MKCWEIKCCCFKDTEPRQSKCQPHKLQIGCWEYDWVGFYNAMPDCDEKLEWRDVMFSDCPECPVYQAHKVDLGNILKGLKGA